MHGGVCGCAEVPGQVYSGTWRCAEVHRDMHRAVWGEQRCIEGCMEVQGGGQRGVCGGGQRVYRGMQRTV